VTKNVTLPSTNEFRYRLDLDNVGDPWTMFEPTNVGGSVKWGVQFNNPTLKAIPVGMDDYEAELSALSVPLTTDRLKFGFSFTPRSRTSPCPARAVRP